MFLILFIVTGLYLYNSLHAQQQTISGTVKEKVSGEALIGVRVALYTDTAGRTKPLRGAITNKYGFFSIPDIPQGEYVLQVQNPGYQTYQQRLKLPSETRFFTIELENRRVTMNEVLVQTSQYAPEKTLPGVISITPALIERLPSVGSEPDVFRTLQLTPGVKSASEISSGLYIRGSSPDQNLILLDGATIYNPSHLAGIFSTFAPEALKNIRLIKGAPPAEFGGRMSGVLDITMKEGNKTRFAGNGALSLISSRLLLEGPITKNGSFMISGRRTYLDLLMGLLLNDSAANNYNFYDTNLKLNYSFSETDQVFVSAYLGRDNMLPAESGAGNFHTTWGNAIAHLRWVHVFSPVLFIQAAASYTHYDYSFSEQLNVFFPAKPLFKSNADIHDFAFRTEAQYFGLNGHQLKLGVETIRHTVQSEIDGGEHYTDGTVRTGNTLAHETSMFVQDEWEIDGDLLANFGLRMMHFSNGQYLRFDPRVSLSYSLTPEIQLKTAFSHNHQFMHVVFQNGLVLPTESWFVSTPQIQPASATQYIVAVETSPHNSDFTISAEVYYKSMNNLLEFRENAVFSQGIPLENHLVRGTGKSYGVELFVNKRAGDLTGWIGYTLAWTTRLFDEINNGKEYYPRFDRRHEIQFVGSYRLSDSWNIGLTWVFASGQPISAPTAQTQISFIPSSVEPVAPVNGVGTFYFTQRNNVRMSDYHRLDLSAHHTFTWFSLPFILDLSIYNVYNRSNALAWVIKPEPRRFGQDAANNAQQLSFFPILPTIGLRFSF